jgi:flagellar hook-associated protein 3 FlgL
MRATQTTTYRSLQSFLDRTSDKLQSLQLQAATGKRMNRSSDDPTAISPVLSARTQIMTSNRYIETIDTGSDRIKNMDGAFAHIENIMQRIREITVSGANGGSLQSGDMASYADEVSQLREELLDAANFQVDGRYMFSGYEEQTKPFTLNPAYDPLTYDPTIYDPAANPPPVLYAGDAGQMQLEIAPGELVRVGVDGGTFFLGLQDTDGSGTYDNADTPVGSDLFHELVVLEADLRAGDSVAISGHLTTIDTASEQTRSQRSLLGNIGRRLELARGHMEDFKIDMEEMRSRYEDADILETITAMAQQEQSFEAALNVTGKVSELSILNYI